MAHRCRCRRACFSDDEAIDYPNPTTIAALDPFILPLLQAAREFDSFGFGGAVEFVQWLSVDTARSAELAVKLAARS